MSDHHREPEGRTDLAYARTVLAVERTYNTWVRTAIGFLAGGLALTKLMERELDSLHGALILAGSTLLVAVAVTITAVATFRYRSRMNELGTQALGRWPFRVIVFVSSSFVLICLIGLICLFML